jgi:hypothetical protein
VRVRERASRTASPVGDSSWYVCLPFGDSGVPTYLIHPALASPASSRSNSIRSFAMPDSSPENRVSFISPSAGNVKASAGSSFPSVSRMSKTKATGPIERKTTSGRACSFGFLPNRVIQSRAVAAWVRPGF